MKFGGREAVKVLCDGRSFHGGDHAWSMPTKRDDGTWDAGEWTAPVKPSLCESGYHLTREPAKWWRAENNVRAYLVEYDGETTDYDASDSKFAVERCRLLRELTREELASLNVFSEGVHTVRDGIALAYGSATVHAFGSATVRAFGSATVHAFGSATVHAFGSATVHASDRSVCTAWRGDGLILTREGEAIIIDRRNGFKVYKKIGGVGGWRYINGEFVNIKGEVTR